MLHTFRAAARRNKPLIDSSSSLGRAYGCPVRHGRDACTITWILQARGESRGNLLQVDAEVLELAGKLPQGILQVALPEHRVQAGVAAQADELRRLEHRLDGRQVELVDHLRDRRITSSSCAGSAPSRAADLITWALQQLLRAQLDTSGW